MSKKDKLVQKLQNNPKNVRLKTLQKLLESAGYKRYDSGSSHVVFRKVGCDIITIPFKRPIKPIYVHLVLEALKEQK